jgi:transcription elongation factor GreB
MSKAFVKEGDEGDDDEVAAALEQRARGPAYITPDGFRALQRELERLWKVERPRVTDEVSQAAAQGDRSENAEYIYGKKKLREIDRRIRFLTKRLDTVRVAEEKPTDRERVYFGAWVTTEDEEGARSTVRIVGPDEIDLDRKWISMSSPLARALLGKRLGDEVGFTRPKGPVDLEIVAIDYDEPKGSASLTTRKR